MKERPILFSAPMVRAILDGTKTQTRRAIKPQPESEHSGEPYWFVGGYRAWRIRGCTEPTRSGSHNEIECPYGQPGDRLWVRENGWERPERTAKMMREGADTWKPYYFDADGLSWQDLEDFKAWRFKRRPSIHMPRRASRITLEITGVRVERLQDISEADSVAEGCTKNHNGYFWGGPHDVSGLKQMATAQKAYRDLWESINGPGSWEANPWVWVVSFKRLEGATP
jgi:hypothetical protein